MARMDLPRQSAAGWVIDHLAVGRGGRSSSADGLTQWDFVVLNDISLLPE